MAVCTGGLRDLDHAAPFALRVVPAEAEIGHQLAQRFQPTDIVGLVLFGKFDDQDGVGIAAHGGGDDRLEHLDLASQRQHGAVDQFHRDRAEFHQMLGGVHRLIETAEMADAEHLVADHRPQFQLDLRGEGEGAFGAHQEMRQIVRRIARHQRVEIVAADAALHFGKFPGDFVGLARAEIEHVAKQRKAAVARVQ